MLRESGWCALSKVFSALLEFFVCTYCCTHADIDAVEGCVRPGCTANPVPQRRSLVRIVFHRGRVGRVGTCAVNASRAVGHGTLFVAINVCVHTDTDHHRLLADSLLL